MNADILPESILKARNGEAIPLEKVSVSGTIRDFAAEISVAQHYRNDGKRNIEAVYTFPLPMGAVLLGLELEIGERRLAGRVVERKEAEARYEDAITDGDTAVMVELTGPGLYTVSFGNLCAGESAVIRYRYGLLLNWQDDRVRLLLPTTLAPRYGDPAEAGLAPHQAPETDLAVEYPFELRLAVEGLLAQGEISCPTHPAGVAASDTGMLVTLNAGARLDRDFVLLLRGSRASSSTAVAVNEGGHVVLSTMRIPPLPKEEEAPLLLKVVIDCSGSMAGMSIAQARKAALEILDQLRPEDQFNITCFGNDYQHLWRDLMPAEAKHIATARKLLAGLDADMGGTETGAALKAVYGIGTQPVRSANQTREVKGTPGGSGGAKKPRFQVLLITDGEVWDYTRIIDMAKKSGHRVFTVGVGMAVAEGLVADLARETGGACELVTAQEGMSESILSQFHRLRQSPVKVKGMHLGGRPDWFTPLKKSAFAGDTLHVYAGVSGALPATVTLDIETEAGNNLAIQAPLEKRDWIDMPRMAAAARIDDATTSEREKKALALTYQLLTPDTRYLVVAQRDDKAETLPELAKVPQMLAAGWGGTGADDRVYDFAGDHVIAMMSCSARSAPRKSGKGAIRFSMASSGPSDLDSIVSGSASALRSSVEHYEIPAFLRRQHGNAPAKMLVPDDSDASMKLPGAGTPSALLANIHTGLLDPSDPASLPSSIEALQDYGLPAEIVDALRELSNEGWSERVIVAAFMMAMTNHPAMAGQFSRDYRRLILANWKRANANQLLLDRMAQLIGTVTPQSWGSAREYQESSVS